MIGQAPCTMLVRLVSGRFRHLLKKRSGSGHLTKRTPAFTDKSICYLFSYVIMS
jgi:hypothetical protein